MNSLLSAYMDAELPVEEMRGVSAHLDTCSSCRVELATLQETKRMVASLSFRAPRAELEGLLLAEAERSSRSPRFSFTLWLDDVRERVADGSLSLRPRPLAATALLSLAGLWMASTALDRSNGPDLPAGLPDFPVTLAPGGAAAGQSAVAAPVTALLPPPTALPPAAAPYYASAAAFNTPRRAAQDGGINGGAFIRASRRFEDHGAAYAPAAYVPASSDASRFIPGAAILFSRRQGFASYAAR